MRRVMFCPLRILTVSIRTLVSLVSLFPSSVCRMTCPTTLVPPHRANYRRAGRQLFSTSPSHILSQPRAASQHSPLPSPSRMRSSVLILYLGVSCSRRGLNRSVVDRPGSGSGATHVLLPLQTSESAKAMPDSTSSSRPLGNRMDSALLLPDSDMAHFIPFHLPPVGMTNSRVQAHINRSCPSSKPDCLTYEGHNVLSRACRKSFRPL
jgi:hypothetical protein